MKRELFYNRIINEKGKEKDKILRVIINNTIIYHPTILKKRICA